MKCTSWSRLRQGLGWVLCIALLATFIVPVQALALNGAISGVVTNASTGVPVDGAYVQLQREAGGEWLQVIAMYTGGDGRFTFDIPDPGAYRVYVEERWFFSATSAAVNFDGTSPETVDVALQPIPLAITGTVRRAGTLQPLQESLVQVFKPGTGSEPWVLVDDVQTGTSGTFSFTLPLGQYLITADAGGFRYQEATVAFTGEATIQQDFILQPAGIGASGRVTDKVIGRPVAGAEVILYVYDAVKKEWSPKPLAEATTGADGTYSLFDDWDSASPLRRIVVEHGLFEEYTHEYSAVADETYDHDVALMPLDPALLPEGGVRVAGGDRYRTAIEASKRAYPNGASAVVIATGENFADALGGAALAGAVNAPLLLTRRGILPPDVRKEIQRLKASHAYILGGNGAVNYDAYRDIEAALVGATKRVNRIEGKNRYETAYNVAEWTIDILGAGYSGDVFVATGANFPDALGASPVAASAGVPVLLADPKAKGIAVPAGVETATITGGTSVVSAAIMSSLEGALGKGKVTRIAGNDRFDTAAQVAQLGVDKYHMRWNGTGVATGMNFPDALAGGAMLGRFGSVMLLTRPNTLSPQAEQKLSANAKDIEAVFFLGGVQTVHENVKQAAQRAAGL